MNQHAEILDADDTGPINPIDISQSLAIGLQRAEIDQLVSTAKHYPRSLKDVQKRVLSMAILDEESAAECMYALPRGGKPIMGPSIRFAEILKQSYGNCTSGARVVHVDRAEMFVEAEGVFVDLETNSRTTGRVRRRISNKFGKLLSDDMIIVTGNAACSIALRNAILGGVPKPLWRGAWDMVQRTIAGDVETLSTKRTEAVKAFALFGVTPARVFEALGVAGEEDVNVEHIPVLRGMYSALRNGESTVEEMFSGTLPGKSTHEKIANPLADEVPASKETVDAATGEVIDAAHAASANVDAEIAPATVSETIGPSAYNQSEPAELNLVPAESSAGAEERPAESLPAGLSSDDRELLRFYVEELEAERHDHAIEEVRTRFWKGKGLEKGSALAVAAGAITDAHRKRVAAEITIEECTRLSKEATR